MTVAPSDPATAQAPDLPQAAEPVDPAGPTGPDYATEELEEPGAADPGGASADSAGTGGASADARPARFVLGATSLEPASVRVEPGRPVALEVRNAGPAGRRVQLVGTDVAFEVAAGETARRALGGLDAGMYTLSVDGGAQASSLVVGDEAAG